ncbi:TrlF family AAA-like ATPase [Qipengyuania spongiae]|uniref:AAA family ATPase n=1 Tax=Qipengyuania spongiae TaxID=2909673 RepID=A0ABY5SYV7_9SPHN|nr:AAA family ATPase [Qipengyuania spongiae]UVI38379.1 AAA family ATPase [Qipengyuania spongiae]
MLTRGSVWRRWEPHIHTPGTVLNDQFGGVGAWESYLSTIESRSPTIEALGVTDYYLTETYEQVRLHKNAGRLPNISLIFPNIELRLSVAAKTGFVNMHLLVSPEDPNHVDEVRLLLTRLQFSAFGDVFDCTREGLIRLGRQVDVKATDNRAALAIGATQFKVDFDQLRKVYETSEWAQANVLIAVAGAEGDGTSGVRQAADATMRQEIEKFAHVIFASSVAQREFWTGQRGVSVEELTRRYNGCKPCLHGSDAHDNATVGQPVQDRFTWIKGAATFDALRQAYIDPAGRAFVGSEPPKAAMPSQVIASVEIEDAPWVTTPSLPLNAGLVAIIGARGSGKTALADMIAAGCDTVPPSVWEDEKGVSPSFLSRAKPLLGESRVKLTRAAGAVVSRYLDGRDANNPFSYPSARYLSQQFVEDLCSAAGASEGLLHEIERVIFEAHPVDGREGALDFEALRGHRTHRFQLARGREVEAIKAISDRIADELEKEALVQSYDAQIKQKENLIAGYNADLTKLVVKGTEQQAQRHAALNTALQSRLAASQAHAAQRRTYIALQDEVQRTKATRAPEILREIQSRYQNSGFSPTQWDEFLLIFKGDVDASLVRYLTWVDSVIAEIEGVSPAPTPAGIPMPQLIADDADLTMQSIAILRAEMGRLEDLISADTVVRDQYAALSKRIASENGALAALRNAHVDAQSANERRKLLQVEREEAYDRLFSAIINEQQALVDLYAPLMARLVMAKGTIRKLSFLVARVVDAKSWADFAEEHLIDCRRAGPFYGRGSLLRRAEAELKPVWQTGTATEVRAAVSAFIHRYWNDLQVHAPFAPTDQEAFRDWSKRFANWVFGTGHISVRYELAYDGIDIRKLSPGTRGIVLLLLYLALDDADDRPLIIDQPEENLDPQSVFVELVSLFINAKSKRQVIMVTHNANLVINTDADQVIVAQAGSHAGGGLPTIAYSSGGLEDAEIRRKVCDILEGGEDAFRERARRLRVRLKR